MKKIMLLLLVLIPSAAIAYNDDYCSSIKIRGGVFLPQASLFRGIYGRALPLIEIEAATLLREHLELWGNIDWTGKRGHSIGLCSPTKVNIVNFSFGLNVPFSWTDCFGLYLGLGPSFGGTRLCNRLLNGATERVSKGAVGVVLKSGARWDVGERAFIDLFVDYLYQKVNFPTHVNVGGVKIGLGLGVAF
jgi:hypothetical protein